MNLTVDCPYHLTVVEQPKNGKEYGMNHGQRLEDFSNIFLGISQWGGQESFCCVDINGRPAIVRSIFITCDKSQTRGQSEGASAQQNACSIWAVRSEMKIIYFY
jgi:hypothetical protein